MSETLMSWLYALAGLIVLAEGLNKLERTDPLQPGLSWWARFVVWLKVFAWICLTLGAGGAIARPFIVLAIGTDLTYGKFLVTDRASLGDLFCLGGFATLIVRSRFKEVLPKEKL